MVRRWSRLMNRPQPAINQLTPSLIYAQTINLYLLYDFISVTKATSAPLRRRLIRRKYYSGKLLLVSQLTLWSRDYRFNKLVSSYLQTKFLFKKSLASYNFIYSTKFLPSQHNVSELVRIAYLPATILQKFFLTKKQSKDLLKLHLTFYSTTKSTKTPLPTSLPSLTLTPKTTYFLKPNSPLQENFLLSSLNMLTSSYCLMFTKSIYKLITLIVLYNLNKFKFVWNENYKKGILFTFYLTRTFFTKRQCYS